MNQTTSTGGGLGPNGPGAEAVRKRTPHRARALRGIVAAGVLAAATVSSAALFAAPAMAAVSGSSIVALAQANVGDTACGTNSLGGTGYESSCTGFNGGPEFWCADFAKWVWANSGVGDLSGLDAGAVSFYNYGKANGTLSNTPEVGDVAVFNNTPTDYTNDGSGIHHVAIVSSVSNGQITTISGDWGGAGSGENGFAGSSHVVANPAYSGTAGSYSSVMGMYIVGYVQPVGGLTGGGSGIPGPRESEVLAPNDSIAVFSIDTHGNLYTTNQTSPSSGFKSWVQVTSAGNLIGTPAAIQTGAIATFSTTTSGQVELVGQTDPSSSYTSVVTIGSGSHAPFISSPAVTLAPNGTVAVFEIGSDGYLYTSNQTAVGSSFTTWTRAGSGGLTGTPAVIQTGAIATFSTNTSGQVVLTGQTSPSSNYASVVTIGSGSHAPFVGDPSAVVSPNGTVAVFAIGSDGYLYESNQTAVGSGFTAWTRASSGGLTGSPLAEVEPTSGIIAVYARTTSGKIEQIAQTSPSSSFASLSTVGSGGPAGFTGDPSGLIAPSNTVVIFALGNDNEHYQTNQTAPGADFKAWTQL